MIYLNNPKLSSQGILKEFKKEVIQKSHGSLENRWKSFQVSLAKIYYDENITPQNFDTKKPDILKVIESLLFSEFPDLQFVLIHFLSSEIPPTLEPIDNLSIPTLPAINNTQSFHVLNQKYGYFTDDSYLGIYETLEPLCRQMSILVEKQAYDEEMAYKLMVLCLSNNVDKPINSIATNFAKIVKGKHPSGKSDYHDTFVTALSPFPTLADVKDINGWKEFILKNGFTALEFFKECKSFEKVPVSIKEAKTALLSQTYPRAHENEKFAGFCKKFRVNNIEFEAGLHFIATGWPKKISDNLPIVDIKVSHDGNDYRWVKLPPDDYRALYLGLMLPGCCQVINGHSAQCVKDGATLADNGFYVLLKTKSNKDESKELIGDVVAQSYAWISKNGNLCLDSIEWDKQRISKEVIIDLMQRFSTKVLEHHPEIKYINVGRGGQTGELFSGYTNVPFPEIQKQGIQYGDSKYQYGMAGGRTPAIIQKLREDLQSLTPQTRDKILYLSAYIEPLEELIADIKTNVSQYNSLFQTTMFQPFPSTIGLSLHPSDVRPLTFEEYQKLPESEQSQISSFRKLLNSSTPEQVIQWLPTIPVSERIAAIQEKNNKGESVWSRSIPNPTLLKNILTLLPENERLIAIKEKNKFKETVLFVAIQNPILLKTILNLLPENERLIAVKEKNKFQLTLLHAAAQNKSSLTTILTLYPEAERLKAIKEKDGFGLTVLSGTVNHPESLSMLLRLYPETERLSAIKEKEQDGLTILHSAARNPHTLKIILELLPKKDLIEVLKEPVSKGRIEDLVKKYNISLDLGLNDQGFFAPHSEESPREEPAQNPKFISKKK